MAVAKKKVINVKIKHSGKHPLPAYQTNGSAAMDLHAELGRPQHVVQGMAELIPTGIYLEIPEGYCVKIFSRSGLADKKGLHLSNGVGIIDSDYRGQIFVSLYNGSQVTQYVETGDRIAQMKIEKVELIEWDVVDKLTETDRGIGGFGSTGDKTAA